MIAARNKMMGVIFFTFGLIVFLWFGHAYLVSMSVTRQEIISTVAKPDRVTDPNLYHRVEVQLHVERVLCLLASLVGAIIAVGSLYRVSKKIQSS